MSDAAEMLRELSEPWPSGEYVKSAIGRAARLARLGYWRAFDIWYGKARRVEPFEIEQISTALRIKNERAARNELHELKSRLAVLEARLNAGDADFYRPATDQIGKQLRPHGRGGRALDR
ncbi:MAG: hypothetical protein NVS3B5_02290 [Sphingomicrobium sp.]